MESRDLFLQVNLFSSFVIFQNSGPSISGAAVGKAAEQVRIVKMNRELVETVGDPEQDKESKTPLCFFCRKALYGVLATAVVVQLKISL